MPSSSHHHHSLSLLPHTCVGYSESIGSGGECVNLQPDHHRLSGGDACRGLASDGQGSIKHGNKDGLNVAEGTVVVVGVGVLVRDVTAGKEGDQRAGKNVYARDSLLVWDHRTTNLMPSIDADPNNEDFAFAV